MDPISNNISSVAGNGQLGKAGSSGAAPTKSFSDTLKDSIEEVSKLQQDASKAVEDLTTGKTENVTGVMTAMEKADIAFKTLLSIRGKLMDAYDEIKGISV